MLVERGEPILQHRPEAEEILQAWLLVQKWKELATMTTEKENKKEPPKATSNRREDSAPQEEVRQPSQPASRSRPWWEEGAWAGRSRSIR